MKHSHSPEIDAALLKSGLKVLSLDAGRALQALIPENEIHAAFLARDDIATLAISEQAARWEKQKCGIAAFMAMFDGQKLYGI